MLGCLPWMYPRCLHHIVCILLSRLIIFLKLTDVASTKATGQTDGFPHVFMLAFDDPAAANSAYERFCEDGVLPTHGHGPWVVFMGCQPGVFTS